MKKIILACLLFLILVFSNYSFASDSNSSLIDTYNNFIIKLETKYDLNNQLIILEKVQSKLDQILKNTKLSTKSIILLKKLKILNNINIQDIKKQINNNYFTDTYQIEIENKEIQKFKDFKKPIIPDYVLNVLSPNRIYLNVIFDEKNVFFEYLYNGKINRLIFTKYYEITEKNYTLFKGMNGYIFYHNEKYLFVEDYTIEEKIPYSESYDYFAGVINNSNSSYFLKNGIYYYYKFQKYSYILDKYGFYQKNLETLGLQPKNIVLFKNGDSYVFVNKYTEEKLINSSYLKDIKNKSLFLSFVFDDKKNLNYDTDKYFQELENITKKFTNGLTRDEKIKVIYNYILENITYTNPIILSKSEIFSGIDTFKNKDGVCEGYAKLMAYMLMYSGIEDIDVIRGFVINAPDFPRVGHAWLKIGDYYYDPTFDDPIGNNTTKKFDEYVYYKLPGDLFYTNRYDLTNLPEEIKSKSKSELTEIVNKNLYNLISKYKDSGYNLLKYTLLLYKNGLKYNEKITISTIKNILTSYDVNGIEMSFVLNGEKKYIKKMKYYYIDNTNIEDLLRTINYDFSNKYLFKWDLGNGTYEYRLAYEVEL